MAVLHASLRHLLSLKDVSNNMGKSESPVNIYNYIKRTNYFFGLNALKPYQNQDVLTIKRSTTEKSRCSPNLRSR